MYGQPTGLRGDALAASVNQFILVDRHPWVYSDRIGPAKSASVQKSIVWSAVAEGRRPTGFSKCRAIGVKPRCPASPGSTFAQIFGDQCELVERGLQVFDDLGSDDIGGRQIGGVFQAFVLEPKDVQAGLVTFDQVVIAERVELLGFLPLVAIFGVVAGDKVVKVLAA